MVIVVPATVVTMYYQVFHSYYGIYAPYRHAPTDEMLVGN